MATKCRKQLMPYSIPYSIEKILPEEVSIISFSTLLSSYELAHIINDFLNINLIKEKDFDLFRADSQTSEYYPFYYHSSEIRKLKYILLKNKYEGNNLLKEFAQTDYFFIFIGRDHSEHASLLLRFKKDFPKTTLIQKIIFQQESTLVKPPSQQLFAFGGFPLSTKKQKRTKKNKFESIINDILLQELAYNLSEMEADDEVNKRRAKEAWKTNNFLLQ